MVLFKDICKASTDLLTKDFPHDKPWDVEAKYEGDNTKFINCATISPTSNVDASTCMKYSSKSVKSELKISEFNGEMKGVLLDVSSSMRKYVEGLSLGTRLERKTKGKGTCSDTLDISCEYENPRVHARAQFNPLATTFSTSSCITCNRPYNVHVGGEVSGGVDMSALKYNIGGAYTHKVSSIGNWNVALTTCGSLDQGLDKMLCNVHTSNQKPLSDKPYIGPSEMAMEVKYSFVEAKTGVTFGGLWYLDQNKRTSLKAKVGGNANVALAISHMFSPAVTGILGMQVDTLKMSNADSVKYGLKLYCTT